MIKRLIHISLYNFFLEKNERAYIRHSKTQMVLSPAVAHNVLYRNTCSCCSYTLYLLLGGIRYCNTAMHLAVCSMLNKYVVVLSSSRKFTRKSYS